MKFDYVSRNKKLSPHPNSDIGHEELTGCIVCPVKVGSVCQTHFSETIKQNRKNSYASPKSLSFIWPCGSNKKFFYKESVKLYRLELEYL